MSELETSLTTELPQGVVAENVGLDVMTVLRNYGIDTVFGIPGTHNLEFYRHLAPLGIHPVTNRHEQGSGYGADGWSQQTGLPGVVVTTSGPGLLNALSAAGTAYCESRPLIILSPGVPQGEEFADIGSMHETKDPTGSVGAIVEWSRRVASGTEAVQSIHDAFELFRYSRPRPIHIEIPLNILEGPSDAPAALLEAVAPRAPKQADAPSLAAAVDALRSAKNPVIFAGGGSLRAGSNILTLAKALGAPVITTLNGKSAIPESHPLSLGSDIRLVAAQQFVQDADVLLVIGSKMGATEFWEQDFAPTGTIIRVDIIDSQLTKNFTADIGLLGDSAGILPQLIDALAGHEPLAAPDLDELRAAMRAEARAMSPQYAALAEAVASASPANTIIAGDSSQATYLGTATFIPQDVPHSFLYTPAYATLGYGLPAAIGARVASPQRPTICVVGDGALMFAIQELATAVEQRLDLVVVCADNGGYGEIKQNELDRAMSPVGVDLAQPNWAALATAFGGTGVKVGSASELATAVATAIEAGGLQLIHVPMAQFS